MLYRGRGDADRALGGVTCCACFVELSPDLRPSRSTVGLSTTRTSRATPPDSAPGKNNRLVARSRGSCCREESWNEDESWLKRIVEVIGKLLLFYGDFGTGRSQWVYITACKVHRYEWSFCTMVYQNERTERKENTKVFDRILRRTTIITIRSRRSVFLSSFYGLFFIESFRQ